MDTTLYYLMLLFALCSNLSDSGTKTILDIATVLLVVRYMIEPFKINLDREIGKAIAFFMGTILLVSFFSYTPMESFDYFETLMACFAPIILVPFVIKNKQQLHILLILMAISVIGSDSYAIWQGIHGDPRPQAFTQNTMNLATILVQVIPFFLVLGLKGENTTLTRIFFCSVSLLSVVALIFNATRGAWVATVVTLLIYAFIIAKNSSRTLTVIVTILISLSVVTITVPQIHNRVESIGDMKGQSNSERLLLWKSAGQMFYDHPLTGVGFNKFHELYGSQYVSPLAKEPNLPHAHNNFMNFLAETGIFGFISFSYLFLTILRNTYRRYATIPHGDAYLAAFLATIGLLLHGLTEYDLAQKQVMNLYWLIIGIGYCSVQKPLEAPDLDNLE